VTLVQAKHAARPEAEADVQPARKLPPRRLDPRAEREADAFASGGPARGVRREGGPSGRGGRPLPPELLLLAQSRLGVDLGGVRIHDDADSSALAADRRARAIAAGGDVYLGRGEYRPDTAEGRELLFHELAHVAEQYDEGTDASQHQDPQRQQQQPQPTGIGASPPDAEYAVAHLAARDEDASLLFDQGRTTVPAGFADTVRRILAQHTGPVVVRIHGYANAEGDDRYDLNLSAHRIVAVRDVIAPLLPQGSYIHLIAHGDTLEWGDDPGPNRRVGVGVDDLPRQPTVEEDAQRLLRRHPDLLGTQMHLDVGLASQFGPITPVQPPSLFTTPPPVTGVARPRLWLDWDIGRPGSLLDPAHPPPPGWLDPVSAAVVVPGIPWALFATEFRSRGLVFGEGDQAYVTQHWQTWYPLAAALYRIRPVGWIFDSPNDLMTTFTLKMIRGQLQNERPTAIEAFDLELQRAGVPTPIYIPFGTWEFDPDFRNWRKQHIR